MLSELVIFLLQSGRACVVLEAIFFIAMSFVARVHACWGCFHVRCSCAPILFACSMAFTQGVGNKALAVPLVAQHLGVPPEVLRVPVVADGLCLSYSVLAEQKGFQFWMVGRASSGYTDPGRYAEEKAEARKILGLVVEEMKRSGKYEEAKRLLDEGPGGYPGMDELPYFANILGGVIELYSLEYPDCNMPMVSYGSGMLKLRLGWEMIMDGGGHESEHFLPLRSAYTPEAAHCFGSDHTPRSHHPRITDVRRQLFVQEIESSDDEIGDQTAHDVRRVPAKTEGPAMTADHVRHVPAKTEEPSMPPQTGQRDTPKATPTPMGRVHSSFSEFKAIDAPANVAGLPKAGSSGGGLLSPPCEVPLALDAPDVAAPANDVDPLLQRRTRIKGTSESNAKFSELRVQLKSGMQLLAAQPKSEAVVDVSMVAVVGELMEAVNGDRECARRDWSDARKRLAAGALCVYRKRLVDISMREKVLLLYIMCGEDMLRAHDGVVMYYAPIGCFQPYEGILPQHMFGYMKAYMLRLEGLFRAFTGDVERKHASVLDAIDKAFGQRTDADAFSEFEDNAIFCKGNAGGEAPEGEHDGCTSLPWYIHIAKNMCSIAGKYNVELFGKQMYTLFVEWCGLSKRAASAIAFLDTTVMYDRDGVSVTFIREKSPDQNVYLGIHRSVLDGVDPVLEAAVDTITLAYERTFWSNHAGFEYCTARESLARRGFNVDTITGLIGPGGVGMSLVTGHIGAQYGPLHKTFDMSVFYTEDELRKQVELLLGGIIFTAQEKPETDKRLMHDLLKKLATGEGLMSRLPYAVLTRMRSIIGWKRLEMNRMLQFTGVTESNFYSLFRRFGLVVFESRFFAADYLAEFFPGSEEYGIFPRDVSLPGLMRSDVGAVAGLKATLIWEQHRNEKNAGTSSMRPQRGG